MKDRRWLYAVLISTLGAASVVCHAQTFIRATLPNPSREAATGYRFQIVTPGDVLEASAQADKTHKTLGDARLVDTSFPAKTSKSIDAVHDSSSTVSFPFAEPVPSNERIDLRIAFTPKEYWKVYFNDVFQYADGHTERSRIPYAAFFITYEPTKDPAKKKASLTVVNNVASSYGISKQIANDDARRPIIFRNAQVYVNNSMGHYDLQHFDHPDGQRVNLSATFTLKAGEAQTFDLGLVDSKSYVLTLSEVSYEGEKEAFPIACSHPDDDGDQSARIVNSKKPLNRSSNQ